MSTNQDNNPTNTIVTNKDNHPTRVIKYRDYFVDPKTQEKNVTWRNKHQEVG